MLPAPSGDDTRSMISLSVSDGKPQIANNRADAWPGVGRAPFPVLALAPRRWIALRTSAWYRVGTTPELGIVPSPMPGRARALAGRIVFFYYTTRSTELFYVFRRAISSAAHPWKISPYGPKYPRQR